MNIEKMRKIDYWVGVPVCFMLSVFEEVREITKGRGKYKKPDKVLFMEFSEMGSVILSYPAMEHIKEFYPNAELYFWIFERNKESVDILPIISEKNIITLRDDNLFVLFRDIFKNLIKIWKENIDTVINLELFARFTAILSYLTGANRRIGFFKFSMEGLYRGDLHTHKVKYNPYIHISKNFLSLIETLKAPKGEFPLLKKSYKNFEINLPNIKSSEVEKSNIWKKLKKFNTEINPESNLIIVNPCSSGLLSLRQWPEEKYVDLIKKLLEDTNGSIFVVLIGNSEGKKFFEKIVLNVKNKNCISLVDKTSFIELVNLFNISNLFISHDSGPPHFAALTRIKTIVLFGPETPQLYAPLNPHCINIYKKFCCSPCVSAYNHRRSLCKNNKCIKAIKVNEVYNLAEEILKS